MPIIGRTWENLPWRAKPLAALAAVQETERPERSEAEQLRLRDRLSAIIGRLQREADKRVGQRVNIEKRWLEDLEQIHGRYDEKSRRQFEASGKSQLFVNQTRAKANAMEARLSDMLFPTDDKNWGIEPTPVPELAEQARQAAQEAAALVAQAEEMAQQQHPQQAAMAQRAAQAKKMAAQLKAEIDEARRRCKAMESEIEDQLGECRFPLRARDVIRDGVRLGTGVVKGPVLDNAARRRTQWVKSASEGGAEVYEMRPRDSAKPSYHRVDPWHFFPDMDASCIEDSESEFERHLWNKKALRRLARDPNFDREAVRRLLLDVPRPGSAPVQHLSELRSITGNNIESGLELYVGWEYHGSLEYEDMIDLAAAMGDESLAADLESQGEDPLAEIQVTIWFCQNEVLKLGIHPLDSGDSLYSVFNLEKDDSSIFGYGVPYIMRDPQRALNAGWRMMMDNAGLSTGPQIVINRDTIEPADGDWRLTPMKIWLRKSSGIPGQPAFETYNIDSHQAENAAIIELSRQFIDDETAIPKIAVGDGSSQVQQTAQGMTILQNAVNVVFRRVVKNWDDDMTNPVITRLYDWNMQFSRKDDIKGDYEVDARGTSVLLVREIQAQNLLLMVGQFAGHPVLGPLTKIAPAYRRLAQSMLLPADEIVMTDDEIEQMAASQPPQPDPEIMKLETQMNIERIKADTAFQVEQMKRDTAMMQLAGQQNITLDKLRADLAQGQADRDSKERIFASEAAMEERQAARGGPDAQRGSGGYLA